MHNLTKCIFSGFVSLIIIGYCCGLHKS